jgi:hypothetical protein
LQRLSRNRFTHWQLEPDNQSCITKELSMLVIGGQGGMHELLG